MAKHSFPTPVSDLASAIIDPVLRKRTGVSVGLVQSWDEIVGPRLAAHSRPEKIVWPRRPHEDDPFEPATRGWITKDRSVPGHIGDPRQASAEKGEILFSRFSNDVAAFLKRVASWDGRSWGS